MNHFIDTNEFQFIEMNHFYDIDGNLYVIRDGMAPVVVIHMIGISSERYNEVFIGTYDMPIGKFSNWSVDEGDLPLDHWIVNMRYWKLNSRAFDGDDIGYMDRVDNFVRQIGRAYHIAEEL